MSGPIRLLGVSGSLRRASFNSALLRAAAELLPEGVTLSIHDLRSIPLYDGDVEGAGVPASVAAFQAAIRESDGVLFATPEYNYSFPGVLKNALDWASRGRPNPLAGKPAAIIGASPGGFGTVRAQVALRQAFIALDVRDMQRPELHVANATQLFSADNVLTDEPTREKLRTFLTAFAAWVRQPAGV